MVCAKLNDETEVNFRHIVIEGSSQWFIGRNVTNKCDTITTNGNHLNFSNQMKFPLQNVDMHSYVPSYIFLGRKNSNYSTYDAMLFSIAGISRSDDQCSSLV